MKCVAMFLPQFHNCPLNSKWWGEGFTEWDNVRKALPLFEGHCQPRVPLDGYFDLLTDGELVKQSELARSYGVDSFSFYHYWSKGKMPLRKPLDLVLFITLDLQCTGTRTIMRTSTVQPLWFRKTHEFLSKISKQLSPKSCQIYTLPESRSSLSK